MQNFDAIKDVVPDFHDACKRLADSEEFNLSKRESEILILMCNEYSVFEISELLCREKTTIYKHLENARHKMSCNSLLSLGVKLSTLLKDI